MVIYVSACVLQRSDVCREQGSKAGIENSVIYYKAYSESRKMHQDIGPVRSVPQSLVRSLEANPRDVSHLQELKNNQTKTL